MNKISILHAGKSVLFGALLAFATLSLQGCNDQTKEIKTEKGLKSGCQMQKCESAKTAKCNTGKCGDAKKVPAMKCEAGKCAAGKCGQGK